MKIIQGIFNFLKFRVETKPIPFGIYHLISLLVIILACVFICKKYYNASQKKVEKLILIMWAIMFVFEVYKQLMYSISIKDGKFVWDHQSLFSSIIEGLKKCKEMGKIPCSIGIDTWGVDYALLDENDNLIGDIYSYRDERTQKVIDEVHSIVSEKDAYKISGIQKEVFNSIYQLYCDKKFS